MCNETGIPELLEFQIPGIPMVVMVTSCVRSLCNPTQQDVINARTLPIYIYIYVTRDLNSDKPSRVHYTIYCTTRKEHQK